MRQLAFILFLSLVVCTYSTDHCVRSDVTYNGDGSTWGSAASPGGVGAFQYVPANPIRGDNYYFASGTHTNFSYSSEISGTDIISFLKATVSAHGPSTGWNDSYASGVALFTNYVTVKISNFRFDGITGSGTSGHGFELYPGYIMMGHSGSALTTNLVFSHLNLHWYDTNATLADKTNWDSYQVLIYAPKPTAWVQITNCYLHHVFGNPLHVAYWTNVVIENNYFSYNKSTPDQHSEGLELDNGHANYVIRNNVFRDIEGTGYIVFKAGTWTADNVKIYNNIFYNTDWGNGTSDVIDVETGSGTVTCTNWVVCHNTMYNIKGRICMALGTVAGMNVLCYNNYFSGKGAATDWTWFVGPAYGINALPNCLDDYNVLQGIEVSSSSYYTNRGPHNSTLTYVASPYWTYFAYLPTNSPFVDATNGNFMLTTTAEGYRSGTNLSLALAPTDFYGHARNANNPDIGAIESGTIAPTVTLTAPASGTLYGVGTNPVLTVSVSGGTGTATNYLWYTNNILVCSNQLSSLTLTNLSYGYYTNYCKVETSDGTNALSTTNWIRVARLPSNSITYPINGSVLSIGTVTVTITTSSQDGSVTNSIYYLNGTAFATNNTGSAISSSLLAGNTYTFTVRTLADTGLECSSSSTVTVPARSGFRIGSFSKHQ